jgi:hypothetical protein
MSESGWNADLMMKCMIIQNALAFLMVGRRGGAE